MRTPAFVPLATKAAVKTLEPREVAELGYELILGNTFHLLLSPGPKLVEQLGGLHTFMRWGRPIITDSGGFQVFSMGHGGVADEIKGRGRGGGEQLGAVLGIDEDGVRFRSYVDGAERFLGPETSMAVQASLGSDIALVLDECTPFHASREYTARSMERTHRWLDRCLRWHEQQGPEGQAVYGIVQGGVEHDLRLESTAAVAASSCAGIAIGGSLGQDKAQMHEVVSWTTAELDRLAPGRPRHLLGIGDVDDLMRCVELGIDTFDCALPTRLGRHGVALIPDPLCCPEPRDRQMTRGTRLHYLAGPMIPERSPEPEVPDLTGLQPLGTAASGVSKAGELTGLRLVTLHNLSFVARLMEDLRAAIDGGRLEEVASALRAGAARGSPMA